MEEQHKERGATTVAPLKKGFEGSVSIITGGASGIGRALALELASRGASAVVIVDRQMDLAEEVASLIQKNNQDTQTKTYEVDVREFNDIQRMVKETKDTFGRLDYCFNNAGTSASGSLEQIGPEDFNYVIDVNLKGVANGCHAAYPVFKEQGFGHIVNTASCAGLAPLGEGWAAYSTSKYGVVGLSQNLRIEGARHGVKVSVLCPGLIDTPLLKGAGTYGRMKGDLTDEDVEEIFKRYHPMDPYKFAKTTLGLVARNKPIIVVPSWPYKLMWFIHRVFPSLGLYMARKENDKFATMLEERIAERNKE